MPHPVILAGQHDDTGSPYPTPREMVCSISRSDLLRINQKVGGASGPTSLWFGDTVKFRGRYKGATEDAWLSCRLGSGALAIYRREDTDEEFLALFIYPASGSDKVREVQLFAFPTSDGGRCLAGVRAIGFSPPIPYLPIYASFLYVYPNDAKANDAEPDWLAYFVDGTLLARLDKRRWYQELLNRREKK